MKLKNIYIIISFLIMQSCSLERFPLTDLAEDNFWTNEKNAKLALVSLYRGSLTDGVEYTPSDWWSYHGMIMMEHLSDNAFDRRGENNPFFQISSGKLTATNNFINRYWSTSYKRIGYCNRFLKGIQQMTDSPNKARLIAEARFLRATQFFYLASYFKDVPLVEEVLTGEEANNVKRNTQTEILEWCVNEFSSSAADLPRMKDLSNSEKGRATKQAALAFLGRTLMLQKDWDKGAEVYKSIIDLGDNAIHNHYSELFTASKGGDNKENIFYIQYLENQLGCGLPQHGLSAKDGGWSLINPAADLFESYEFVDGTPFSYTDSRYNPDNLGENRDPRLDYTIYYNGSNFLGATYRLSPDYDASKKEKLDYTSEASRTGFMMRKYFDESSPILNLKSYSVTTPVIRYAEVLLGYLECMLESDQAITQVLLDQTINAVRQRADVNMPAIKETDKTKLRELLRNERRVELAMEGIRYWDLLRWNIAHMVLNQKIWGAPYPQSVNYESQSKEIDPTGNCRWYVGKRSFREQIDYTWPIPQSEQNINPNLRD